MVSSIYLPIWQHGQFYLSTYLLIMSQPRQPFINAVKMLIMPFDPSPLTKYTILI